MKSAHSYEELVIWQLGCELRDRIFELTKHGPASRDLEFQRQIRKSSSSVPSNIAEGFAYFKPKLFARHLRIAIASLDETKDHLQDGAGTKGYLDPNAAGGLIRLTCRTRRASKQLLRYLDSCKGEAPIDWTQFKRAPKRRTQSRAEHCEPPS
jgi:four helix bundle protein